MKITIRTFIDKTQSFLLCSFFLFSFTPITQAQVVPPPPVAPTGTSSGSDTFAGLNFGVGISLTSDTGANSRVNSAILDSNGIVRIESEQNDVARVMLESHYFFHKKTDDTSFLYAVEGPDWGHGPFIALQPGTDEIIEAIGFGWMVGFKRPNSETESWNLGLGVVVDPSVSILGDGIKENEPLPDGETQIRFKETSQTGVFFLVSFSF